MRLVLLSCVVLWGTIIPADALGNRGRSKIRPPRHTLKLQARRKQQNQRPTRFRPRPKRIAPMVAIARHRHARRVNRPNPIADGQSIDFKKVTTSPGLSRMASKLAVRKARRKLGVDFQLDWNSGSKSMRHFEGRPIEVPGGMLRTRGLTLDGLFLMLAHEAAHAKGIHSEAKADFWATKHGLRKLWGSRYRGKRTLRAAYSALTSQSIDGFKTARASSKKLHINAAGYPTAQSRWNLYRRGAYGRPMPEVTQRDSSVAPTFLAPQAAAALLGVSASWLATRASQPGGPSRINTAEGPRYVLSDLEHFKQTL